MNVDKKHGFLFMKKGLQVQTFNTARTIRDIFISMMIHHYSKFLKLVNYALHAFLELEVSCVNIVPLKLNTCIELLVSPLQFVPVTSLITESFP